MNAMVAMLAYVSRSLRRAQWPSAESVHLKAPSCVDLWNEGDLYHPDENGDRERISQRLSCVPWIHCISAFSSCGCLPLRALRMVSGLLLEAFFEEECKVALEERMCLPTPFVKAQGRKGSWSSSSKTKHNHDSHYDHRPIIIVIIISYCIHHDDSPLP